MRTFSGIERMPPRRKLAAIAILVAQFREPNKKFALADFGGRVGAEARKVNRTAVVLNTCDPDNLIMNSLGAQFGTESTKHHQIGFNEGAQFSNKLRQIMRPKIKFDSYVNPRQQEAAVGLAGELTFSQLRSEGQVADKLAPTAVN